MIRLTVTWLALASAPARDFTPERVLDGVAIASRSVEGSGYSELQFQLDVDGEATALCARIFGDGRVQPGEPYVLKREVLRQQGPNERVTWELIAPPMVSRRDMVVRTVRQDGPRGCRVDFEAIADAHADEDAVRVAALRGSFVVTPVAAGKLHVEHRIHFDPGGLLSPFVVEPGRRSVGVTWLRRLVRGS
ncbi:MAG: hypothetical protein ACOZQL_34850 [Myxococcota bacterium]